MERSTQLTQQQILMRLAQLLAQKLTGTFLIATDRNTSCRFALQEGKITHCTHSRDQGIKAIQSFALITNGSCSFAESQLFPFHAEAGVDHATTLVLLNLKAYWPELRPQTPVPPPAPIATDSKEPPAPVIIEGRNRYYRGTVPPDWLTSAPDKAKVTEPPSTTSNPINNRFYRGYVPNTNTPNATSPSPQQMTQKSAKSINQH